MGLETAMSMREQPRSRAERFPVFPVPIRPQQMVFGSSRMVTRNSFDPGRGMEGLLLLRVLINDPPECVDSAEPNPRGEARVPLPLLLFTNPTAPDRRGVLCSNMYSPVPDPTEAAPAPLPKPWYPPTVCDVLTSAGGWPAKE